MSASAGRRTGGPSFADGDGKLYGEGRSRRSGAVAWRVLEGDSEFPITLEVFDDGVAMTPASAARLRDTLDAALREHPVRRA